MKLVVGLGNPGKEYKGTRHNIGFDFLDFYLNNVSFKVKKNYETFETLIGREKIIFLKPLTFMNESGLAIKSCVDYYKLDVKDILVIYDDMDFDLGKFKLKKMGTAAGHNGIKSIIQHLNTEEFNRLRIGISRPKGDKVNYVLGKFSKMEEAKIQMVFKELCNVLKDYFSLDFEKVMNKYN